GHSVGQAVIRPGADRPCVTSRLASKPSSRFLHCSAAVLRRVIGAFYIDSPLLRVRRAGRHEVPNFVLRLLREWALGTKRDRSSRNLVPALVRSANTNISHDTAGAYMCRRLAGLARVPVDGRAPLKSND